MLGPRKFCQRGSSSGEDPNGGFPLNISPLLTVQRISSDKASNLPKRDVNFCFVEITNGDQQIYKEEPSMHHCPRICILKTGFPLCV